MIETATIDPPIGDAPPPDDGDLECWTAALEHEEEPTTDVGRQEARAVELLMRAFPGAQLVNPCPDCGEPIGPEHACEATRP